MGNFNFEHPFIKDALVKSPETVAYLVACYPLYKRGHKTFPFYSVGVTKKTYEKARTFIKRGVSQRGGSDGGSKNIYILREIEGSSHGSEPSEKYPEKPTVRPMGLPLVRPTARPTERPIEQNEHIFNTKTMPTDEQIQKVAKNHNIDYFRLHHEWSIKVTTYQDRTVAIPDNYMTALTRLAMKLSTKEPTKKALETYKRLRMQKWWSYCPTKINQSRINFFIYNNLSWFRQKDGKISVTEHELVREVHNGKLPDWI